MKKTLIQLTLITVIVAILSLYFAPISDFIGQLPGLLLACLILPLLIYFILRPIIHVYYLPQVYFDKESVNLCSADQLDKIAKQVQRHGDSTIVEKVKFALNHGSDLRPLLCEFLEKRDKNVKDIINRHALLVTGSTAISQSGLLDGVAVVLLNVRMIKEISTASIARPNLFQLGKIYLTVFTTTILAYSLEELLESTELTATAFSKITGSIPFIGTAVGSLAQGATNGFFTLRLGHICQQSIINPILNRGEIRKNGFKFAIDSIKGVITTTIKTVSKQDEISEV